MDADRAALVNALRSKSGLDRAADWLGGQFSLDSPDQDFLSAETAGDTALGLIPGVGQAMAVRDIVRGLKKDDYVEAGTAALGLVPFGNLAKKGKGAIRELIGGGNAMNPPRAELDEAVRQALKSKPTSEQSQWEQLRAYASPRDARQGAPRFEISDRNAKLDPGLYDKDAGNQMYSLSAKHLLDHPELYRQYPHLADIPVEAYLNQSAKSAGGVYRPHGKGLNMPSIEIEAATGDDFLKSLLHELQHGIQQGEPGFAKGSHSGDMMDLWNRRSRGFASFTDALRAREAYLRNYGEAEARAVERRWARMMRGEDVEQNVPTRHFDRPQNKLWHNESGIIWPNDAELQTIKQSKNFRVGDYDSQF